ncbi:hypothetical protein [Bradyrhizobium canariense]|uniref:hypothetical protein n=1 Tax=Bradyrhizobium canariense TaxID=255045 RepID=UPI001B89F6E9|nr:hypothetical protein [Bradyrhizobium canariense]MBR0954699.1 hypothetical protein [Bradyrhizobium canariense]
MQRVADVAMLSNCAAAAFANSHDDDGVCFCRAFRAIEIDSIVFDRPEGDQRRNRRRGSALVHVVAAFSAAAAM